MGKFKWVSVSRNLMKVEHGTERDLREGVFLSIAFSNGEEASGALSVLEARELADKLTMIADQIEKDVAERKERENPPLPTEFGTVLVSIHYPTLHRYVRVGEDRWIGSYSGAEFTDAEMLQSDFEQWTESYRVEGAD